MREDKSSRREVVKKIATIGTAGSFGFSTLSSANRSRWKTMIIPAAVNFEDEKEALQSISGIEVKSLKSGKHVVRVDQKEHPPLNTSQKKQLEEHQRKARQNSLQTIHSKVGNSSNNGKVSTSETDDYKINVGEADVIVNMAFGYTDKSHSGDILLTNAGNNANLGEDQAEAAIISGGGLGSATRTAAIGCKFVPNGEGEVSLLPHGWYNGFMMAAAGAGFDTRIHFHVKDGETGAVISNGSNIYKNSGSYLDGKYTGQTYFDDHLEMTLEDGRPYYAYVVLEATVNGAIEGAASSDFGPQDGDSDNPDQCAFFTKLDFRF